MGNGDMAVLRRWVVIVLLGLLVFVVVARAFFGERVIVDQQFYWLVGGVVGGLFVAEGVNIFRRNGGSK